MLHCYQYTSSIKIRFTALSSHSSLNLLQDVSVFLILLPITLQQAKLYILNNNTLVESTDLTLRVK